MPVSTKLFERISIWKESKYFALGKWNIFIVMLLFSCYSESKRVRKEIYVCTWHKSEQCGSKYAKFFAFEEKWGNYERN